MIDLENHSFCAVFGFPKREQHSVGDSQYGIWLKHLEYGWGMRDGKRKRGTRRKAETGRQAVKLVLETLLQPQGSHSPHTCVMVP